MKKVKNKIKNSRPAQTAWVDPKNHTITFTLKRWDAEKYNYMDIAVKETAKMYLVALAEKGWTQEQLIDLFEITQHYDDMVKKGFTSVKIAEEIIEQHTGMTCGN